MLEKEIRCAGQLISKCTIHMQHELRTLLSIASTPSMLFMEKYLCEQASYLVPGDFITIRFHYTLCATVVQFQDKNSLLSTYIHHTNMVLNTGYHQHFGSRHLSSQWVTYWPCTQQTLGPTPTVATNIKIENNNKVANIMIKSHLKMEEGLTPKTLHTTNTSQTMRMSNIILV
jgi:hypothetical protein